MYLYETHCHTNEASACAVNSGPEMARAYKAGRFGTVLAANQMRYSEEEREKVLALRAQGLSWRAIAEQTGVKMATCRKWVMAAQNPKSE